MKNKTPKKRIKPTPEQAERVMKLAQIGATVREIADIEKCGDTFIDDNYSEELKEGRASLRLGLRRAQIRLAIEKQNCSMLIFLGKAYLHQSDTPPPAPANDEDFGKEAFKQEIKKLFAKTEKTEPIKSDN